MAYIHTYAYIHAYMFTPYAYVYRCIYIQNIQTYILGNVKELTESRCLLYFPRTFILFLCRIRSKELHFIGNCKLGRNNAEAPFQLVFRGKQLI